MVRPTQSVNPVESLGHPVLVKDSPYAREPTHDCGDKPPTGKAALTKQEYTGQCWSQKKSEKGVNQEKRRPNKRACSDSTARPNKKDLHKEKAN